MPEVSERRLERTQRCAGCGGDGRVVKKRADRGVATVCCVACSRAAGYAWEERLVNCRCVVGTQDGPCPLHGGG